MGLCLYVLARNTESDKADYFLRTAVLLAAECPVFERVSLCGHGHPFASSTIFMPLNVDLSGCDRPVKIMRCSLAL